MGARTPHELMRCAEVSFIRDCAELAARASMVREESRWGLYHERADLPERDDTNWFFHLNVRRRADGAIEFVRRPVADYLVPVPDIEVPEPVEEGLLSVVEPQLRATGPLVAEDGPVDATTPRSPRILELLELAESGPSAGELEPFLADDDAEVRRTAVATVTEIVPAGTGLLLARALVDADEGVRRAAATALRELVEVLPAEPELAWALEPARGSADPVVRAAVLDTLRALVLGSAEEFRAAVADDDVRVRLQAVRGLVSLDDVEGVAGAAGDPEREIRVAVAHGLGRLGGGADTLVRLAGDDEPLVRAAALEAAAGVSGAAGLDRLCVDGLAHQAWQVRTGAARGLGGCVEEVAVPALLTAVADPHLDVRKAAVIALGGWTARPDVRDALEIATKDTDADVRGYARRQLREQV
jgi:HEAT repeat protein